MKNVLPLPKPYGMKRYFESFSVSRHNFTLSSPICLKCIVDVFVSEEKYQKYCSPPFPMDFPRNFPLNHFCERRRGGAICGLSWLFFMATLYNEYILSYREQRKCSRGRGAGQGSCHWAPSYCSGNSPKDWGKSQRENKNIGSFIKVSQGHEFIHSTFRDVRGLGELF